MTKQIPIKTGRKETTQIARDIAETVRLWPIAPMSRSRAAFARTHGISIYGVKRAIQKHRLKKPAHWAGTSRDEHSQEKLDRAIEKKWRQVKKFETRLAFAQAAGISVSRLVQWMKRNKIDWPANWKRNTPVLPEIKALWPKAASYKSQVHFVRDHNFSYSSVLRAMERYGLKKPKHWPSFPRTGKKKKAGKTRRQD